MNDDKSEEPTSGSEPLTDEQLDAVSGAGEPTPTPTHEADDLKPYPPWPESPVKR